MMIADLVKRLITFVKIKNNHLKCGRPSENPDFLLSITILRAYKALKASLGTIFNFSISNKIHN